MDRRACIGDLLGPATRVLEFGPLDRPVVPPGAADVHYLDHASNAELAAKYAGDPAVDTAAIPPIAYVIPDNDLAPVERAGARFDLVVAAHVFEHLPDPLGWLRQVARILAPGGRVFLVVPDMRFTFDAMRRPTALADWVEALLERRDRPAARHVFEHFAAARQADPAALWSGAATPAGLPALPGHRPAFGLEKARVSAGREAYVDTHCSVFTPASLVGLLRGAAELELFDYRFDGFWPTARGDMEFALRLAALAPEPTPEASAAALEAPARRAGFEGPFDAAAVARRQHDDHRFRARYRAALLDARAAARATAPEGTDRHGFPDLDPALHGAVPPA